MKDYAEKWDKLKTIVEQQENKYYELASRALEKGHIQGSGIHAAEASAFQRVRYIMEEYESEESQ